MRAWIKSLLVAVMAIVAMPALAQETYQEGVHYDLITPNIQTGISDRVVVTEFFSYGCGHCFNFEPMLAAWEKRQPENIVVQRSPIAWNAGARLLAKVYYTAVVLDAMDPMHDAIFRAIHLQRKRLATPEAFRAVFVDNGIDAGEFDKAFDSFGVNSMVRQADARMRGARINGTPSLMVNGKYRIDTRKAGSQANMLKIAEFLAEKELARINQSAAAAE